MLWLLATLLAGTGFASSILISKHVMKDTSSLDFSTLFCVLGSLFSLPFFLYVSLTKSLVLGPRSLAALVLAAAASTGALLSINEAVRRGEISLAYPLSRMEPVFALFLGFMVLNEPLTGLKTSGVILATIGAYIVVLSQDLGFKDQLKELKNSRSAHLGILSAFLYSVAAVADKVAVKTIEPLAYNFLLLALMSVFYLIYQKIRYQSPGLKLSAEFRDKKALYLVSGLVLAASYYSFVKALSLAEASRVVPVLQVEILISVIGGYLIYDEEDIRRKLVGSALLVAGIILVAAPQLFK